MARSMLLRVKHESATAQHGHSDVSAHAGARGFFAQAYCAFGFVCDLRRCGCLNSDAEPVCRCTGQAAEEFRGFGANILVEAAKDAIFTPEDLHRIESAVAG